MDVSIQMISGTESGKKALKLENFIKFCEILRNYSRLFDKRT